VSKSGPYFSMRHCSSRAWFQFRLCDGTRHPRLAFLDSFSVTIQDAAQRFTAIISHLHATGIVWAPPSRALCFVDPASITATPVVYPILQPVLSNQKFF